MNVVCQNILPKENILGRELNMVLYKLFLT